MKNGIKILMVGVIFCIFISSCSKENNVKNENKKIVVTDTLKGKESLVGNIECTFPLTNEDVKFNILSFKNTETNYDNVYVWNKYEEMTGIDVEWTTETTKDRAEIIYTALTNAVDYNLMIRCKASATRLTQYGENGLILDLNKDNLLEKNAPNCWAFLKSHPATLASVMNPDGSIYALPQVNSGAELRVMLKMFINKEWLKRVNMELPTTTEELYQVLKAFKEQDANGNGDVNDEIPMCTQDWTSIEKALAGAFGLMNRGEHNSMVDCDETTGKVRFTRATQGYRSFLEYCNRLYTEGLIDSNVMSITKEEWTKNAANDLFGVFMSTNLAGFPDGLDKNWIGIEEAIEGPNGDKLWTAIRADFHSTGNAIIPATCDNPELVLKWLDYFWTDEGTLFYHMGIEGETFVANNDGTYDYSPKIYKEIEDSGKTFDEVIASYSPYPGGGNPTVEIAPYFMGGEMAEVPAKTARELFKYGPKEYWPSFTFTKEETERLNIIKTDIEKYCNDMKNNFVTGTTSLSEWDNYILQLNEFKVDELVSIYQAAFERYNKMLKK